MKQTINRGVWYQNDELHRDGGLPAVIHVDGTQEWWKNGKQYQDREDLLREVEKSDMMMID